jgi:hypothetical protein
VALLPGVQILSKTVLALAAAEEEEDPEEEELIMKSIYA